MILAIPISVGKNRLGVMRDQRAIAEFDRDVAHMPADPLVNRAGLLSAVGYSSGYAVSLRLDLWRYQQFRGHQGGVGASQIIITFEGRNEIPGKTIQVRDQRSLLRLGCRVRVM